MTCSATHMSVRVAHKTAAHARTFQLSSITRLSSVYTRLSISCSTGSPCHGCACPVSHAPLRHPVVAPTELGREPVCACGRGSSVAANLDNTHLVQVTSSTTYCNCLSYFANPGAQHVVWPVRREHRKDHISIAAPVLPNIRLVRWLEDNSGRMTLGMRSGKGSFTKSKWRLTVRDDKGSNARARVPTE
jgi:hypothetical protein